MRRIRIVPLNFEGQSGNQVVAFGYKFSDTQELSFEGVSGRRRVTGRWIRILRCNSDFERVETIGEIDNADLIDAVPVDPANRMLMLGSSLEESRARTSRRAYTRTRYWLEDPLSGNRLDDLLAQPWNGKSENSDYRPMALGGRTGQAPRGTQSNAIIAALREDDFLDSVQVSVVVLNVLFDQPLAIAPELVKPFTITNELILFSTLFTVSDWGERETSAQLVVSPVSRNSSDGWVVAFSLAGPVLVSRVKNDATLATAATALSTPPPNELRHLKVAGGMYRGASDARGNFDFTQQRSFYLAAFTNVDPDGVRRAWGTRFDWNGTAPGPSADGSRRYTPASSVLALIDDRATCSHWYLATDENDDERTNSAWPFVRLDSRDAATHLALIGHDARVYRRWAAAGRWKPLAFGFDGTRKRAVIAGGLKTAGETAIELSSTGHASHVIAVPGEAQGCPTIGAGLPAQACESHRPFGGHRFFTVRLMGGPSDQRVTLVVSSKIKPDSELCTSWIPTDASPGETFTFTTTTDASGNATATVRMSADTFPLSFPGESDPDLTNIVRQPDGLFVAQWQWFQVNDLSLLGAADVDLSLFDWSGGPEPSNYERSAPVEIRGLVSNLLLLFVAP